MEIDGITVSNFVLLLSFTEGPGSHNGFLGTPHKGKGVAVFWRQSRRLRRFLRSEEGRGRTQFTKETRLLPSASPPKGRPTPSAAT